MFIYEKVSIQAKIEILPGRLVVAQCSNRDELKAQPTRGNYKVSESPRNSVIRLLNLKAGVKFRVKIKLFYLKSKGRDDRLFVAFLWIRKCEFISCL